MARGRTLQDRPKGGDSGFYMVIVALLIPIFVGILGLAVDSSHFNWTKSHLQNAADASALAGSKDLNSTSAGRTRAATTASSFATQHKVDGIVVNSSEVTEKVTGSWNFTTKTFTSSNVTDLNANAIRVTVRRQNVPTFFSKFFTTAKSSQTMTASATAVAGGARQVACGAPVAIASCMLSYDSDGKLICPTSLSFQNGFLSVGLTIPDGSSPANGNKAEPYFTGLMSNPTACPYSVTTGNSLYLQNGNDLTKTSVDTINAATADGASPVSVAVPVVDLGSSCPSGANYNQSAAVVGFLRMKIVGGRWTSAAPTAVNAACSGIGKKNICVTGDCSAIPNAQIGSAVAPRAEKVFIVK
jgi:Flp pilus assembly protein TadG